MNIDPCGLEPGTVHFGCVKAYDSTNVEKGAVFEVPVTVVIPVKELINGYKYERCGGNFGCFTPPLRFTISF